MTPVLLLLLACGSGEVKLGDSGDPSASDGGAPDGGAGDGGTETPDGGGTDGGSSDGGGTGDGGAGDGGSGGGSDGGGSDGGTSGPVEAPDYRESGPYSTSSSSGSTNVGDGCTLSWTRVTPGGVPDAPVVIYGHGFQRSAANHTEVAAHLASWGLDVVLVDFCHSSAWDADHEQNGLDMVALADALGLAAPLYAGHSAGGLAALLAGAADGSAAGVLGMDPVDASDLGIDAAGDVSAPTFGVFGEASWCNAHGNGLAMYGGVGGAELVSVADADHCDFEGPSDWLCTTFCTGGNDTLSDTEITGISRALATAALLWASGAEDAAAQWWTPGEGWYDALAGSGAISAP